ncbi:MAG: UDP-N-acetylmuramoyl-L-alanyl-D-glutamate--2,6-diaminopimelate ligase, partial [Deltaproteobacteria bacterium]|nr:UDP-N-acetylmuramoyl-L-alanyl-D-glutamate--2,6-diaminopimelate ligase [Deltaproteobacteria bacterium]MBW2535808.1 UDP-N-acetylmuramoyl-L-alanyl-D-glutamate--2,6-diaminopimelate ligase [Deltaproteobacteria bacterium]
MAGTERKPAPSGQPPRDASAESDPRTVPGVSWRELVSRLPGATIEEPPADPVAARAIRGVQQDSRRVRPGDLFVALRGERSDGAAFVAAAAERGA